MSACYLAEGLKAQEPVEDDASLLSREVPTSGGCCQMDRWGVPGPGRSGPPPLAKCIYIRQIVVRHSISSSGPLIALRRHRWGLGVAVAAALRTCKRRVSRERSRGLGLEKRLSYPYSFISFAISSHASPESPQRRLHGLGQAAAETSMLHMDLAQAVSGGLEDYWLRAAFL
ncbi:hypothetical protein P154DRAFT_531369 [Amniculicola lignicola CBS 123094]|uniref:Uncharacterized protein n=1 Tax=Amniculicola lignicola CBS 123094 TaxID=1392246 RepID=A0A6A5WTG8_9PLEO|nr:hypothetical protein P154DRAFT_531369 [Amniculicola lignicola CBS 123094]